LCYLDHGTSIEMTAQILVEALGVMAAVCSTTSFIPQLVKLLREKTSGDVSLRMYVLTVSAFSLWSVYGLVLKSWPLVVSNLISLVLSSAILLLDLRYRGRGEAQASPAPR
jgi:MtN3 and saliva related transmembrane protein